MASVGIGPSFVSVLTGANGGAKSPPASGDTLTVSTGMWSMQIYNTTITVTDPAGNVAIYDASDPAVYSPRLDATSAKVLWVRSTDPALAPKIDSIKVSKVGF